VRYWQHETDTKGEIQIAREKEKEIQTARDRDKEK